VDDEFNEFAVAQISNTDLLIFGRVTYEGMASYWSSAAAEEDDPIVAPLMNSIPKVVVSTTLDEAAWNNSTLIKDDVASNISALKEQEGKDLAIFGSPRLTVGLIEMGLVDELRIMVQPVALGAGKSLFTAMNGRLALDLLRTTIFASGNVLLTYKPLTGRQQDTDQ
jgi:dihydrofolate reductase